MCRKTPPSTEQSNDAISGLLNERVGSSCDEAVGRRVCQTQRLETAPARSENNAHDLDDRLVLNPSKVIALLLAQLRRCLLLRGDPGRTPSVQVAPVPLLLAGVRPEHVLSEASRIQPVS